jgi:hypothetical protein
MQANPEEDTVPDTLSEEEWFERLENHAKTGTVLNLLPANPRPTDSDPAHADLWSADRTIPANAIRRILTASESEIKTFHPSGLRIQGARIDGNANWNRIAFPRQLAFAQCEFTSPMKLVDARIATLGLLQSQLPGLYLDAARIDGGVVGNKLTVTGVTSAAGAHISGQFNLIGATLTNFNGRALVLDSARISMGLFATDLIATGEIRAVGAHIGDQLNLHGATITNPTGRALNLDGARIDGTLFAGELTTYGETRAAGAHISGKLTLHDATLTNTYGQALKLNGARIENGLLAPKLRTHGEIRAIGTQISGQFDLNGATLAYCGGDAVALTLERSTIDHLLLVPDQISGGIRLDSAKIGTFEVPQTAGTIGDQRAGAFIGSTLSAAGWSVTDVRGAIRQDWTVARDYLEHTPAPTSNQDSAAGKEFIPQPWFEIADVYDRIGHPDHARKLRLRAEHRITRTTHGATKTIRNIYAATVGYGYRPFLPVLWLLGVLVTAGLLIWTNQDQFINSNHLPTTANDVCTDTSGYTCFNTIAYTLQNVVPAASGPLRPDWALSASGGWPITLGISLAVLRLVAWGFAALTLAAMTGLLRKR